MTLYKKALFLASLLVFLPKLNGYAQDVQKILDEVSQKIEYAQYDDADILLCSIDDTQIATLSDSCTIKYYVLKGICLWQLFRYEEAILFFEEVIHRTEMRPDLFYDYISSLYMLGNCYKNEKQYDKAEGFLRKVMIKDYEGLCKFTTASLHDLTEIYNKQGYVELANECVNRIRMEIDSDSLLTKENWKDKVTMLYNLALSYEIIGKVDEEINIYYEILEAINKNAGNGNDDYLFYSYSLSDRLCYYNLNEKAVAILEKMINIGREVETNSVWICEAYVKYLILMARNDKADLVRDLLRDAKEYFRKTMDFEFNHEVLRSLYYMIGNAFSEAGNLAEGARYRLYGSSAKLDN